MKEQWKKIRGYGNSYYVSDLGNVRTGRKYKVDEEGNYKIVCEKIIKATVDKSGYAAVNLTKNKKSRRWLVHRLICKMFLPNPEKKPFVNHKNGIKNDNRLENLEWCTHSENMQHAANLRKSLGIFRKTKAHDPRTVIVEPMNPERSINRELVRAELTYFHYRDKLKKGLIEKIPESVIEWKNRCEAMVQI